MNQCLNLMTLIQYILMFPMQSIRQSDIRKTIDLHTFPDAAVATVIEVHKSAVNADEDADGETAKA